MTNKKRQTEPDRLDGQALTHELYSDAYMAGTSDGVQQLADGEMKIEAKPYPEAEPHKKP